MAGTVNRVEGVLVDFLTPILPNIVREPTREFLIKIRQLISGNVASVVSKIRGGRHGHLALTMTARDYLAHMGHMFVPLRNPGDLPLTMSTTQ